MSSDISNAKGALTGERYIESLRDGREVWLDGKRVDDVTTHPAFSGMVHEMARIYDLQYTDEYIEQMTYPSRRRATASATRTACRAPTTR